MLKLFIMRKFEDDSSAFCGIGENAEQAAGYTHFDSDPREDVNFSVLRTIPLNREVNYGAGVPVKIDEFFDKLGGFLQVMDSFGYLIDVLNVHSQIIFEEGAKDVRRY